MTIRVLLADPEESLLKIYRNYLTARGFEVATATTGGDCLRLLREWRPDVMVLEPELRDGWRDKLLPAMRDDPDVPSVPVIVLSRNDHMVSEKPVHEYYVKPFSMARLAKSIQNAARIDPSSVQ